MNYIVLFSHFNHDINKNVLSWNLAAILDSLFVSRIKQICLHQLMKVKYILLFANKPRVEVTIVVYY
jgi:hypothetical protein